MPRKHSQFSMSNSAKSCSIDCNKVRNVACLAPVYQAIYPNYPKYLLKKLTIIDVKYNPDWEFTGAYLGVMPGGVPTRFKGGHIQVGIYNRKKGVQRANHVSSSVLSPTRRCGIAVSLPGRCGIPAHLMAKSTPLPGCSRTSMATTPSFPISFTPGTWNMVARCMRASYPH